MFLGSVFSGGRSDPKSGNGLIDWTDHYDSLQARTQNTRLRIPLLYGIDAVHGHSNVLSAVLFPHNIGLGCTRNPELVERAARMTAIGNQGYGYQLDVRAVRSRYRVMNVGAEPTKDLARHPNSHGHSAKLQFAGFWVTISAIL